MADRRNGWERFTGTVPSLLANPWPGSHGPHEQLPLARTEPRHHRFGVRDGGQRGCGEGVNG
jgi:hypothetical protein